MSRILSQYVFPLLFLFIPMLMGGCVTAHEAETKLLIRDNTNNRVLEDCLLLTIRMESLEKQGHWWVVQEESGGHMIPQEVTLTTIHSGNKLFQKGKVIMPIGPYVRGHVLGVEYWLYRPGYQPDDFLDEHIERTYEDKIPLEINMLPEDSGGSISDEKVLDGARRALEVANFLSPDNVDGTRLFQLLIEQVRRVKEKSYKDKFRRQARDMLPKLQKELQRFPRVKVSWRNLPPAGSSETDTATMESNEKPISVNISSTPETPGAPATPDPSTETPPDTPKAASKTNDKVKRDILRPQLIPVPLDEATTDDETIVHDLKPIRKKNR